MGFVGSSVRSPRAYECRRGLEPPPDLGDLLCQMYSPLLIHGSAHAQQPSRHNLGRERLGGRQRGSAAAGDASATGATIARSPVSTGCPASDGAARKVIVSEIPPRGLDLRRGLTSAEVRTPPTAPREGPAQPLRPEVLSRRLKFCSDTGWLLARPITRGAPHPRRPQRLCPRGLCVLPMVGLSGTPATMGSMPCNPSTPCALSDARPAAYPRPHATPWRVAPPQAPPRAPRSWLERSASKRSVRAWLVAGLAAPSPTVGLRCSSLWLAAGLCWHGLRRRLPRPDVLRRRRYRGLWRRGHRAGRRDGQGEWRKLRWRWRRWRWRRRRWQRRRWRRWRQGRWRRWRQGRWRRWRRWRRPLHPISSRARR